MQRSIQRIEFVVIFVRPRDKGSVRVGDISGLSRRAGIKTAVHVEPQGLSVIGSRDVVPGTLLELRIAGKIGQLPG